MSKRFSILFLTATIAITSLFSPMVTMAADATATEEVVEESISEDGLEETSEGEAEEAGEAIDEATEDGIATAKNGVVQINCVYVDGDKNSHIFRGSTGILIGSSEKDEYVLTSLQRMVPTDEEKKTFLSSVGVSGDDIDRAQLSYEVVIENDITAIATMLNSSADLDLAVFKLSQVLYNRTPMTFLYSSENDKSKFDGVDTAYALGFPEPIDYETNVAYFSNDRVNKISGQISNVISSGDSQWVEHKAEISANNVGGPLVTVDGQVIGMNSQKLEGNYYYAVSSNTLVKVLSGMGVAFDGVTFEDQEAAAADAEKKAKEKEEEEKRLALEESRKNLQPAMPKWVIPVIIVMGVVLLLVIIALVVVIILSNKKNKKDDKDEIKITNGHQNYQFQPTIPAEFAGGSSSDTTVLGAGSATIDTMAGVNMAAPSQQLNIGNLERQKNGEIIAITKMSFCLGKDDLHCDYCVRDNNTISRQHAIISVGGSATYIEDNNSKNGTFLNGVMLVPGQRQELRDGDEIKLSNEVFIYRK
jgi:S1-C subfamily serine protease